MKTNIWIGEPYMDDPETIRFDTEISTFNPPHSEAQYLATKMSIEKNGQNDWIHINSKTGLCEDGIHRVKIAIELGRQVLCRKINNDLPLETRLSIANKNIMAGRDFNPAQRAVQALRYSKKTKSKLNAAAEMFKVDRRLVGYAATISGLGRDDILDTLLKTGEYSDGTSKPSSSIKKIARELKAAAEQTIEDNSNKPDIDYEDYIYTEKGKAWFWKQYNKVLEKCGSEHEIAMLIVELANYKFEKIKN